MEMLLIMVVFIGLMYVLMVLPQKRKMDAQRKLIEALEPGARVMLNTGMFGTVRATGNQQMVVELAPGVEVTVLKQAVMRTATAAEEEFEYSDGSDELEVAVNDAFASDPDATWNQPETNAAGDVMGEQWPAAESDTVETVEAAEPQVNNETNFYGQPVSEDDDTDRPQAR